MILQIMVVLMKGHRWDLHLSQGKHGTGVGMGGSKGTDVQGHLRVGGKTSIKSINALLILIGSKTKGKQLLFQVHTVGLSSNTLFE